MSITDIGGMTAAAIVLAFFLGGLSKGGVGFGLPLIAIPVMATVIPVPLAIALLTVPIISVNVWQALAGRRHWEVLRRMWPIVLALLAGTTAGAQILTAVDQETIQALVGVIVIVFVVSQTLNLKLSIPPGAEVWCGPLVGALSGLLGGIASMFGPPMIMYLVALRLPAGLFVSALGVFYLLGVVPLYVTLVVNGILGREEMFLSVMCAVPLAAGVVLGAKLRSMVPQQWFYRFIHLMLFAIAMSLLYRGFR